MEKESNRTIRFSPCVSICALNENDICIGCYRTADEISQWADYDDDEVREIMKKTEKRYKEYQER